MGDYGFEGAAEFGGTDFPEPPMTDEEIRYLKKRMANMDSVIEERNKIRDELESKRLEDLRHQFYDNAIKQHASIEVAMIIKDPNHLQDFLDEEIPGFDYGEFIVGKHEFEGYEYPEIKEDAISYIRTESHWGIFQIPDDDQAVEVGGASALMSYVEDQENRSNILMSYINVTTY